MRAVIFFVLAMLVVTVSVTADEQRYIALVGVGEARAVPNISVMNVTITERAGTSMEASNKHLLKVAEVLNLVERVLGDDIRFISDTVSIYEFDHRRGRPADQDLPRGFEARQMLTFRFDDKASAETLYSTLVADIPDIRASVGFDFPDTDALYIEARKLAVRSAKVRANAYAAALDVEVGNVLIIEESGANQHRIAFDLQDRIVGTYRKGADGNLEEVIVTGTRAADATRAETPQLTLSPDTRAVSVTIYAKFALNER